MTPTSATSERSFTSRLPRSVSIDPGVFDRAAALAKERGTSVHRLMQALLEAELARADEGAA